MAQIDQKLELLKHVPLLHGLSRKDLEEVGQLAEEVDVPDGHVLCREGTFGTEFFMIVSGQVRIDRGGQTIRILDAGDFLGEIALIDEGPRSATATAVGPTTVLVLTRPGFRALMDKHEAIEHCVLRALATRIRNLDTAAAH
ncbi:MAG TPA: cyclic nucleotide-binding domain-containing protein [Candidatus Limnocylindrales bacterium]|nr:cyclic nucleotide-binding domain-containing protein [Candidatus Limnocylindrales bacterium]